MRSLQSLPPLQSVLENSAGQRDLITFVFALIDYSIAFLRDRCVSAVDLESPQRRLRARRRSRRFFTRKA
ncbi:hypothetical protein SBDP1_1210005 [Syntrophobacter sp. SbD1]|nr:hypothetical protein SBDP1_1210005 [Syntrophobacter sp. SbD1]